MTTTSKGVFFPISTVKGNDVSFSVEFIVDGTPAQFEDYEFIGEVFEIGNGTNVGKFDIVQNPDVPHLIDVSISTLPQPLCAGLHRYEIKYITKAAPVRVNTLLRGSFTIGRTFAGVL